MDTVYRMPPLMRGLSPKVTGGEKLSGKKIIANTKNDPICR